MIYGPFPSSNGYTHILVVVDYVTKWVEAIPTGSANHKTSIKMLKEVIFPGFGVPRYLMADGIHGAFCKMLAKYDVNHRIASPYHPQSSGQVELSIREIELILQKTVNRSRKNWSKKLDDALWSYRTAHKVLQSVFIGLLFSKMPISLSCLVMNVKELVILVDVKKCL